MAVSFLKRGATAHKALEQEEAAQASKNYVSRFFVPVDGEKKITFLDGGLTDKGLLDAPMMREHQLNLNGHWRNWFICLRDEEPCPICEMDNKPYFAAVFSVINHTGWTSKTGDVHKDEVELFVAKRSTIKLLTKIANKREGLAGCTFEISRTGDKVAAVGDVFDFEEKLTKAALKKKYPEAKPMDYEKALTYKTADELKSLGFGVKVAPPWGGGDEPDL